MSATSMVNFIAIILAASLLIHKNVTAQDYDEIKPVKSSIKVLTDNFSNIDTLDFFSKQASPEVLGLDGFNKKDTLEAEQHQIEQFFLIDSSEQLQQKIAIRFQTGSYSLKNNYVLSSNYKPYFTNQLTLSNAVENDLYQLGRFSAETGYAHSSSLYQDSYKAYVRSAFSLVSKGRFDLSLTASFESFNAPKYGLPTALSRQINSPATSTTLGVIGSFDLSERWSLISAITVSQLDTDESSYSFSNTEKVNMALIGTTYSF